MRDPSEATAPEVKEAAAISASDQELVNNLYAELKPEAQTNYVNHFLNRTPAHLQDAMKALLSDDLGTPPTAPGEGA